MTRSLGRPSSYLSARCTIFEQVREWLTPPRFRAHARAFSDAFTVGLRMFATSARVRYVMGGRQAAVTGRGTRGE